MAKNSTYYLVLSISYKALYYFRHLGKEQQLVVFQFSGCVIGRHVAVDVSAPGDYPSLHASHPYTQRTGLKRVKLGREQGADAWIVPGQQPARWVVFLPLIWQPIRLLLPFVTKIINLSHMDTASQNF